MKKMILFSAIMLVLSCKKEETKNPIVNKPSKYLPLEVGNYWVYQHFIIDTVSGEEMQQMNKDSIYVSKDSTINAKKYFILDGKITTPGSGLNGRYLGPVRDSNGYLVNNFGTILFTDHNYSDTFNYRYFILNELDTLAHHYNVLEDINQPIYTPAATFSGGLNFVGYVHTYMQNDTLPTRRWNDIYVEGVGKVLESYFYLNGTYISERRLSKYYIQ